MAEKKIKRVLRVGRDPESSLSSFVERPVPTEKEVATFERIMKHEAREQEIDSNLSEIYRDREGNAVDVKKMTVKKRPQPLVRFFFRLLAVGLVGLAAYAAYALWSGGANDVSALKLEVRAPESVTAGEEFSYVVEYQNSTKFPLSRVNLELQYPNGFVFKEASQAPNRGNHGWDLPDLGPGEKASLVVTGRLIAPADSINIIFANLSYLPGSFSSEYRKEASASVIVSGLGFRADLDYSNTAFLNQDNELSLVISEVAGSYLGDFLITFSLPPETDATVLVPAEQATGTLQVSKSGGASWQVSGLEAVESRQTIAMLYKIKTRLESPEIKVRLEKKLENGEILGFWERSFRPELVSSDLNLALSLNGSRSDGAVNFGQTLNYSLEYSNRGSTTYRDVAIMASVSGDFLDWNSLVAGSNGRTESRAIIWTKEEVPALAEVRPGAEGTIEFKINLRPFRDLDQGKKMTVTAYGQYSLNNQTVRGESNKSNTITSRLNSDLSLTERVLYFNDDNIPVGSGPLPPRVSEKTTVRTYWTVRNNLHELAQTKVVMTLPPYVSWEEGQMTNVGRLYYDEANRQVVWEIGRLPVSVYRIDAEFNLGLTPAEADRNKLLIVSPGASISAYDTETRAIIEAKAGSKTTKLEDDDIAGLHNSGIVQ